MKILQISLTFFLSVTLFTSCGHDSDHNSDPAPSLQNEVSGASADASKVTLWSRSGGYDSAIFLPADYGADPTKKYPLVISLHGFNGSVLNNEHTEVGGKKTGFIKQVWDTPLSATYPGIVVAPDVYAANTNENSLWDHGKLRDLIQDAMATYQVDPDRITVTGISAGSIGAQELALKSKDLLAGVMPGAFDAVIQVNTCAVEDLPFWAFGNTSDVLFQPASWRSFQGAVAKCDHYSNEFTLTIDENECGHDCWDDFWSRSDVQNWLVNQKRKD